jgi:hypothetical protein
MNPVLCRRVFHGLSCKDRLLHALALHAPASRAPALHAPALRAHQNFDDGEDTSQEEPHHMLQHPFKKATRLSLPASGMPAMTILVALQTNAQKPVCWCFKLHTKLERSECTCMVSSKLSETEFFLSK